MSVKFRYSYFKFVNSEKLDSKINKLEQPFDYLFPLISKLRYWRDYFYYYNNFASSAIPLVLYVILFYYSSKSRFSKWEIFYRLLSINIKFESFKVVLSKLIFRLFKFLRVWICLNKFSKSVLVSNIEVLWLKSKIIWRSLGIHFNALPSKFKFTSFDSWFLGNLQVMWVKNPYFFSPFSIYF